MAPNKQGDSVRDLCESAKRGHVCIDSICRANPDDTLCGFSQEIYDEIVRDSSDEPYEDDYQEEDHAD